MYKTEITKCICELLVRFGDIKENIVVLKTDKYSTIEKL